MASLCSIQRPAYPSLARRKHRYRSSSPFDVRAQKSLRFSVSVSEPHPYVDKMPLYEVEYCTALSTAQQDRLAKRITHLHSRTFTTPSFFVQVDFVDVSRSVRYVAGKKVGFPMTKGREPSLRVAEAWSPKRIANRIQARVRPGGRTYEQFAQLCKDLKIAWDEVVNNGKEPTSGEKELRVVVIYPTISAMLEAGLVLPQVSRRSCCQSDLPLSGAACLFRSFPTGALATDAILLIGQGRQGGQDKTWLTDNIPSFKRLADSGDDDFKDMLHEIADREDLKGRT